MLYILFNPLANNNRGEQEAKDWAKNYQKECELKRIIGLNVVEFFKQLKNDDEVVICGGDGTLNRFVNDTYNYNFRNNVYLIKGGTGNDFYRDVKEYEKDNRIDIMPFIKKLPRVKANGIEKRFVNGIGFGLDGDTCNIGDEIKKNDPDATVNYTSIAIKLLLFTYKIKNAHVIVDDQEYDFKNVWVASAMNGRYYGGGMMAAPNQDRIKNSGKVDLTILTSKGRVKTLLRFPTFSSGKHEGNDYINHFIGQKIKVTFDKPCALQIDGDVIKNVSEYEIDF